MMNHREKGSALLYILIAIALLAVITATFMGSSSQQTSGQKTFNSVTDIGSQIQMIRSTIQSCVLTYPQGDAALAGSVNVPFPIMPTSTYFTGSTDGPAAQATVSNLRCPGNPGNSNNHVKLFSNTSGKFLPPAPKLFKDWYYYNGPDGVFFSIATSYTDAFLLTALKKLDDQFSECEADVIEAGATPKSMDSGGLTSCIANDICFRVRLLTRPSATYLGDSDGDEVGCP